MNLKSHFCSGCAALVLAAGTAGASSIVPIDLDLRVDSYLFSDVEMDVEEETFRLGDLPLGENPFGFPQIVPGAVVGDVVSFTATIQNPDPVDDQGFIYDCSIAGFDCIGDSAEITETSFSAASSQGINFDYFLAGGLNVGNNVLFSVGDPFNTFVFSEDPFVQFVWNGDMINFTVVRNNLAIVPLPATGVALLAALGLLINLRRRS